MVSEEAVTLRFLRPWVVQRDDGAVEGSPNECLGGDPSLGEPYMRWTTESGTLTAEVDRYGVYPAFYARLSNGWGVSSDPLRLLELGAERNLDDGAIAAFLRTGFFLFDQTPWTSVRAFDPGMRALFHQEGLTSASTTAKTSRNTLNAKQAAEAYIDTFRVAIRRRLPTEPITMPVSGGRDSRMIMLELLRQGADVSAVTTSKQPPYPTNDVPAAQALCQRLRVSHRILEGGRRLYDEEQARGLRSGLMMEEGGYFVNVADYLAESTLLTYDGYLGDVLTGNRFFESGQLDLLRKGNLDECAEAMFSYRESPLKRLLHPDAYKRFGRDVALNTVVRALREVADEPNPIGQFLIRHRSRREVAPQSLMLIDPKVQISMPFLDVDLYDALVGTSAETLLSDDVTTRALHLAYPEYADLPLEKSFPAKKRARHSFLKRYGRDLLRCLPAKSEFVNLGNLRFDAVRMAATGIRVHHRARQLAQWLLDLEAWI